MTNDYIRREDVVDAVKHAWAKGIEPSQYIESLEPADVVPVVRCKDCENWQTDWNPSIPDRHYCAVMDSMMKADAFCSYGERREG